MNILILTPDRVGSTLLQRLVTIYSTISQPEKITVNLHELTNGIVEYHNDHYDINMIGKKDTGWGYHQSLAQITDIISNSNTDIVSRLAHYHIKNRKDPLADQLSFYEFLNKNFFIVSARRRNILEHALSWGISVESKKLNVYTFEEKYETFKDIHENKIDVDQNTIVKYLNQYNEYLQWVDSHFQVNSYFYYEDHISDIENYILGLNPFKKLKNTVSWEQHFGIEWNDWNRVHYLLSLVAFGHEYTVEEKVFIKEHITTYTLARTKIQDMMDAGLMISGVPIKLHSFANKAKVIQNLDNCLTTYNKWVEYHKPSYAIPYTHENIIQIANKETPFWNFGGVDNLSKLTYNDISETTLLMSDLKNSNG